MASIHDLCNPEPEESDNVPIPHHLSSSRDYPPGPHPQQMPQQHHPALYQHDLSPHHYPRQCNGEHSEPHPPPLPPHSQHSSISHDRGDRHSRHHSQHYKPYPPPSPHHIQPSQPYPQRPLAPSHSHHHSSSSSHHYHDQYESSRHGYDPQQYLLSRPRSHSPPPHPSMNGASYPYDHYPPGPQHHQSQGPDHQESPREHPRDHLREHSHLSSHHSSSSTHALVPVNPVSTSVPSGSYSVSESGPNGAVTLHTEHRPITPEHVRKETPKRSFAHVDERPAKIKIVQQPRHARMCGFGEKDRRPIDPPPIVQLLLDEDHEQHPTKRMQRSAAAAITAASKKVENTSTTKSNDNSKKSKGGQEDEDETYQLDDDYNGESQLNRAAAERRGSLRTSNAKGRAGSLQLQDSNQAVISGTGSSPSLRKRSRPSNDGDDNDDKAHSDRSHSGGSDDEGDDDDDDGQLREQDPLFVLHVSLWSADGSEVRNMIATPGQSEPPKLTRILMGSLVVSPVLLNNPEGVPGWYFSFPDLSIRTEGEYTLKFSLMRFGSFDFLNSDDGHASGLVAEEISEKFTVFSAKKFPGMTESTELSKAFAKQGLKIPIRNDLRARKADRDK